MNVRLVILLLAFPIPAMAQVAPIQDSLIRRLMTDLTDSWTLGIDSNSNAVDISTYNKYKGLFDPAATVDDDMNVRFVPAAGSGAYVLRPVAKDFDVYAHDAALEISKLRVDSIGLIPRTGTGDLLVTDRRETAVVVDITRTVYIEKPARYLFQEPDSLASDILKLHPDIRFEKSGSRAEAQKAQILSILKARMLKNPEALYKFVSTVTLQVAISAAETPADPPRIASIRVIANELRCVNDADNDGITDAVDAAPFNYGAFTADGALDADLDGVTDLADKCLATYGSIQNRGCPESYFFDNRQLEGALGVQVHSMHLELPGLNELGFRDGAGTDMTDVLQSRRGSIGSPRSVAGFYAAGSDNYFFGRNARSIGISIGFSYSRFSGMYSLQDSAVYTYKSSDGFDDYRRQITVSRLSEKMGLSVINIPVQLDYRFKVKGVRNLVINLKAGPSLTMISGTSDYNALIDVGGIYQVDPVNGDRIVYTDNFDPASSWNVYLTSAGIDRQNSSPGAAAVFAQLSSPEGYDFVSNKTYRDQTRITRLSYALNFALDGQYRRKLESPLAVKAGVQVMYAPSIRRRERYAPIERTTDDYNSVFNSNGSSRYFAYALNLGLVYNF